MFKLTTVETKKEKKKEEAEQFIREEREKGVKNGYDVSQAAYKHYDKKAKGATVDSCAVVSITKVFADKWDA